MSETTSKPRRWHRNLMPCLLINGMMILFLTLGLLWLNTMAVLEASMIITQLDREGAIDEAKLQRVYPQMTNLRHDLAVAVVAKSRGIGNLLGILGIGVCLFNSAMAIRLSYLPSAFSSASS